MTTAACRICGSPLAHTFANLGLSPLANSYISKAQSQRGEMLFPLHAYVCSSCFLVQLEEVETPEHIFSDYAYFSGMSSSWLEHAQHYVEDMCSRFALGASSKVVEVASNDGYLLQYFVQRDVPVLGVEPAANVAKVAVDRGVPTRISFFGRETAADLARDGHAADLMAANNVLAHVPDILDFVAGFRVLLKPEGVGTFEFPHLLRLIEEIQFDTIYHEHYSYLALGVVADVLTRNKLRVFDVQEWSTHGGSLRVFFCHEDAAHSTQPAVAHILEAEKRAALRDLRTYAHFGEAIVRIKCATLRALIDFREAGKVVCGYGAAAKGNTFLNYCGIGTEFVRVVADKSPHKQGTLLPGSRIPVVSFEEMLRLRPDYVLILPWNLKDEIARDLSSIRAWGGQFITAIPDFRIF